MSILPLSKLSLREVEKNTLWLARQRSPQKATILLETMSQLEEDRSFIAIVQRAHDQLMDKKKRAD